jgi:hypothetical protein
MSERSEPLNILETFTVLQPDLQAVAVDVSPTLYQELDENFNDFKGHVLVSSYRFDSDWSSWEIHPAGDEIVCLLAGETELILDRDGTEERIRLAAPGSYAIVPKGIWHTARTGVATHCLFITPGEGTRNRPV